MNNLKNPGLYCSIGVLILTFSNWLHGTQRINDTVFTVCMIIVIVIELIGLIIYSKNKKADSKEA